MIAAASRSWSIAVEEWTVARTTHYTFPRTFIIAVTVSSLWLAGFSSSTAVVSSLGTGCRQNIV